MFFKYFSRQILFSRTFQDSPVYSSTFQACANPDRDLGFLNAKGLNLKYKNTETVQHSVKYLYTG